MVIKTVYDNKGREKEKTVEQKRWKEAECSAKQR